MIPVKSVFLSARCSGLFFDDSVMKKEDLKEIIRTRFPLTDVEAAFKYACALPVPLDQVDTSCAEIRRIFNDPEIPRSPVMDFRDFTNILKKYPEEVALSDSMFFETGQNISIANHPRYMPRLTHMHENFFELQCVFSGTIEQNVSGTFVKLVPGDICFIAPKSVHSPHVEEDDTILVNILIRTTTLRSIFPRSLAQDDVISNFLMHIIYGKAYQPMLICHAGIESEAFDLILDLVKEGKRNDAYTDKLMCAILEVLFIRLLRDHTDDFTTGVTLKNSDENILNIMRYVQSNSATVSLSELAGKFNYSESHLSTMIKNFYGVTFRQMLTNLRLKNAAQLLVSTDEPVSDIISEVGYSEKSYFYRAFKSKYGLTPQDFRDQHRKSDQPRP